jgi:hypothetical protein
VRGREVGDAGEVRIAPERPDCLVGAFGVGSLLGDKREHVEDDGVKDEAVHHGVDAHRDHAARKADERRGDRLAAVEGEHT